MSVIPIGERSLIIPGSSTLPDFGSCILAEMAESAPVVEASGIRGEIFVPN